MAKRAPQTENPRRLIVAITGATGAAYGVRLLEVLRATGGWESHLVLSDAGVLNAWQELGLKRKKLLLSGQFSPQARAALKGRGWELTENFRQSAVVTAGS